MTSLAVLGSAGFHAHSRHHLAVTDTCWRDGTICVEYLVTPVPRELTGSSVIHESEAATAIDQLRNSYPCTLAYRRARTGDRVVGVLRVSVGVETKSVRGIRVLFSPFAETPGLSDALCQLNLVLDRRRVKTTAVQFMRASPGDDLPDGGPHRRRP